MAGEPEHDPVAYLSPASDHRDAIGPLYGWYCACGASDEALDTMDAAESGALDHLEEVA